MEDGRRKNAPTKVTPAVTKIDAVGDDMLELVFLRLPLPLHLVRAACTCRRWRRIIAADDGRVIRSLHGTQSSHVVGHYRVDPSLYGSRPPGRNPVFIPCFSSPWADILGARRNLALDFLPSGFWWELADVRGGLVLLQQSPSRLILCDPLMRRYKAIQLSASFRGCQLLGAFLLDGEVAGASYISLSNFRVTCALQGNGIARACVFSSAAGGRWTNGAATRGTTSNCGNDYGTATGQASFAGSTETSAYWTVGNGVLAMDKEAAELSWSIVLPDMFLRKPQRQYACKLPWPPLIRACLS